ncbi:MAG: hypothetical protein HY349_03810 [Nitrospirae bacterium]|nr:hypothetical protein [Nitrospirota bacterium]
MTSKRLKSLWLDNILIKIVSLVFAVILWFYVNATGGAEMDITVPLDLKNVPADLAVAGDMMGDVNVHMIGRERILQGVASRPIRAVLDLSDAREGDNVLFLDPSAITIQGDVKITQINPRRIVVRLEPRDGKGNAAHESR